MRMGINRFQTMAIGPAVATFLSQLSRRHRKASKKICPASFLNQIHQVNIEDLDDVVRPGEPGA
jgi:hypothetical protein